MLRAFDVSQGLLDACDVTGLGMVFGEVEEDPERVRMLRGSMGFRFPNHDERGIGIWLDPVVCAWGRAAHEEVPHLPYYMYLEPPVGGLLFLVSSFSSPEAPDLSAVVPYLVETALFAEKMADDWRPILADLIAGFALPLRVATTNAVEAAMRSAQGSR